MDKWHEAVLDLQTLDWDESEDPEIDIDEERRGTPGWYRTIVDEEHIVVQITEEKPGEKSLWVYWRTEE